MAGFYGKVPCKGDFVTRNIPRTVVDNLYKWLQLGLQASKEHLSDDWLEQYAVAPIWHFYIGKDVISNEAWVGIWMPSVDKVGRHFPICVIHPVNESLSEVAELSNFNPWFFECEDILLDGLEESVDFDSFCQEIINSQAYQRVSTDNEIDDVFASVEQKDTEQPKTAITTELVLPQPATPLEKHLVEKVKRLEQAVTQLCKLQGLDFSVAPTVAAVPHEIEQPMAVSSTDVKHPPVAPVVEAFDFGVNMAESPDLLTEADINCNESGICIWFSDGNDTIARQQVVTKGFPDDNLFYKFLVGF